MPQPWESDPQLVLMSSHALDPAEIEELKRIYPQIPADQKTIVLSTGTVLERHGLRFTRNVCVDCTPHE